MVEFPVSAGVDMSKAETKYGLPILVAIRCGIGPIVECLIRSGADVKMKNDARQYKVIIAAIDHGHADLVPIIVKAGASVLTQRPRTAGTLLHRVIGQDHASVDSLGALLDNGGADELHTPDPTVGAVLPLTYAILLNRAEMARRILGYGVQVADHIRIPCLPQTTPMLFSVAKGHLEMSRLLLQHCAHADLNVGDADGQTPLMAAVKRADLEWYSFF